ncbi:DUF58 domain-containing protein [Ruicaihuangia caeni]|uniref:DUF58 domain-containing protein n=1 Tax=Ruicaihuangia caeni TaxID=3042517 RepID=A0AAW6T4B8_9MICO|nr:DUF58 domain-containing protein [Klugiella sp. YN-L-19]MDI2098542.1 DUF58 domain-containing protein [Klugiella sp. YN-L-19]
MSPRTDSDLGRTASSTTSTSTSTSTGGSTRTHYATTRAGAFVETAVRGVRTWQRLRDAAGAARRWVAGTVTPIGWLALSGAFVLLPLGLGLGWTELVVAGAIGAALVLFALPFLAGGRAYDIRFELRAARVVAGDAAVGDLTVTNASRTAQLPGTVEIPIGDALTDVAVPFLRAGNAHSDEVVVPTERRGVIMVGPATSVRSDPLGVFRREVDWAEPQRLHVHPVTTALASTSAGVIRDLEGNPTRRIVDSDLSFHAIREYATGDGQRHIHWKSTAKTGTLMVRQFEESRRSRIVVMLAMNDAEFGADEEYELAVSVAGSLGARALRDGRELAVLAGDEVPEFARASIRSVRSLTVRTPDLLLDELSTVERSPLAMPLADACALASRIAPDMSIVFIVCGSGVSPRQLRSLSLAFPADAAVVAVLCDPDREPSFRELAGTGVFTIALLDDLRALLGRRAR